MTTTTFCLVPLCGEQAIGELAGRPFCGVHVPPLEPCKACQGDEYRWSEWVGWVCVQCCPPHRSKGTWRE